MSEYPILFNSEMVRAILDGRKTQTRRVVKLKNNDPMCGAPSSFKCSDSCGESGRVYGFDSEDETYRSPYGKPGDQLWVRETWGIVSHVDHDDPSGQKFVHTKTNYDGESKHVIYREESLKYAFEWMDDNDNREHEDGRPVSLWKPSIHMPRWASRIQLEVTNVRVERVQDITEEDAKAEGVNGGCLTCGNLNPCGCSEPLPDYRDSFIWLWDSINKQRGFGCYVNPWVWVVEFKIIERSGGHE